MLLVIANNQMETLPDKCTQPVHQHFMVESQWKDIRQILISLLPHNVTYKKHEKHPVSHYKTLHCPTRMRLPWRHHHTIDFLLDAVKGKGWS